MTTVGTRADYGTFIPSYLDDYPLTPCEFRVYARILRRAGTKGGHHWESIPNMATACGMDVKTVRAAIRLLEAAKMVTVVPTSGRPSEITPTHHDVWAPPEMVATLRAKATPTKNGRGTKNGTPTKNGRTPLPKSTGVPLPKTVGHPYQNPPTKVPLEGTPMKEPLEGNPPLTPQGGERGGGANFSNSESEPTEQGTAYSQPAKPPRPIADPTAATFWEKPWRDAGNQLSPAFCEYVGNLFPGDSNKHPRTKGRNHIINLERSGDPSNFEKLNGYWDDYNQPGAATEATDEEARRKALISKLAAFGPRRASC